MTTRLFLIAAGLLASVPCFAEPVTLIRNNGPDNNRLNIVIMGDGYTAAELRKFATDADLLVTGYFAQEPYKEYASYFNIHRIDVTSNESGVDHPERNVTKDTALGARYNCNGTQRLICVDTAAVNAVLSRSITIANVDLVMVLVNDSEYGGSGGRNAVASTHTQAVELMLHEAGHTLGLLTDEYEQDNLCNAAVEPAAVNGTKETARDKIKWRHWIADETRLPTTVQTNGIPGLFLGGAYCPTHYRPTFNSKMRTLGRPFEQIGTEQHIKRFYNFVSPIESVSPESNSLRVARTQPMEFSVRRPRPLTYELQTTWTLDGRQISTAEAIRIEAGQLSAGRHTLEVAVHDQSILVRSDATAALTERFTWTIDVQ